MRRSSGHPSAVAPRSLLGTPLLQVTAPVAPTITVMMRRREDMLFLQVDGYNLVRKGQKLVRKRPGKATIVFTFVPQHLTEQAFFETKTNSGPGNETPASPGSTSALLAQPSRIAFNLPASVHSIPFTVAGLAVWNFDTQTRTFASPGPPTLKGSGPPESALGPFRTSLTPNDRYQIVKLTSDFALSGRADVQAKKLWLTSRGGFLDSDGVWDDPTLSLVEWKHLRRSVATNM